MIRCVSSSYEVWYPICPPSYKDVGVLTKNLKFGCFGGVLAILPAFRANFGTFLAIWRFLGANLDAFWAWSDASHRVTNFGTPYAHLSQRTWACSPKKLKFGDLRDVFAHFGGVFERFF